MIFRFSMIAFMLLASAASAQVRLVTPEREQFLRASIPWTENEQINRIAADQNLILYSDAEMPSAYQHDMGGSHRSTFFWSGYNISADPSDSGKPHGRGGNGNIEFPWRTPGGTDPCPNVSTFKFLWLPPGKPIVYYNRPVAGVPDLGFLGMAWCFPKGTVFGEVLTMRLPDGYDYAFEMRTREKQDGEWEIDLFRPFPTAKDLADVLPPDDPVAMHLRTAAPRGSRLVDANHHNKPAFDVTAEIDELPAFADSSLAAKLLRSTVFKSAEGKQWRGECYSPTTRSDAQIVPAGYQATFIGTDTTSCTKCHESALQHVSTFEFPRGWYGAVRGSDQILSFHPVEPSCISRNGAAIPIRLRQEFVAAGILMPFDATAHADYREAK